MKSANSQPLVKPDAVEYGININPFHRNPRLSIVRQMPKPPPISERDSWQTLIEDGRLSEFAPEDLLRSADAFRRLGTFSFDKHIMMAVIKAAETALRRGRRRAIDGDSIDYARGLIHFAIARPESARGRALRARFQLTVIRAIGDANRSKDGRPERHKFESAGMLRAPEAFETSMTAIIQIDRQLAGEKDARARQACFLRLQGYTEEEAALEVGSTAKTVREWTKRNKLHRKTSGDVI